MKDDVKKASIQALEYILADTYVLTIKTQNVHWNAKGENFIGIHQLLDDQYSALSEANDTIAERIRALGGLSPSSMKQFISMARLSESEAIRSTQDGVQVLSDDHARISALLSEHIQILQGHGSGDEGTIDLLVERIRDHDKQAWLLRSNLSN